MEDKVKVEFQEAFERHSDELFRHAALRLPSRERAVELTQDCFLRAWEYVSRSKASSDEQAIRNYRSFLYRILHNLIIDEYRRARTQSLDAMLENDETRDAVEGTMLRDETNDLEAAMVRHEASRALKALQKLPAPYRDTLVMRYIDGLSIGEIAEAMGETQNAVSVRIHRALGKLRETLEKNHDKF